MIQIDDPKYIEIITTLEMIEKTNQAILFHQKNEVPDKNSIENYQRLKDDFERQLIELLKEWQIDLPLTSVA